MPTMETGVSYSGEESFMLIFSSTVQLMYIVLILTGCVVVVSDPCPFGQSTSGDTGSV